LVVAIRSNVPDQRRKEKALNLLIADLLLPSQRAKEKEGLYVMVRMMMRMKRVMQREEIEKDIGQNPGCLCSVLLSAPGQSPTSLGSAVSPSA